MKMRSWSSIRSMATMHFHCSAGAVGNKLPVAGGIPEYDDDRHPSRGILFLDSAECFDLGVQTCCVS